MNEYYGSNLASSDFFAHYGVKGMKWGVRKAIERGSEKALARQYRKAVKKLKKLSDKADIDTQAKKAKTYGKIGKAAAGVAATGGLMAVGGTGLGKHFTGLAKNTYVKHLLNNDRYREFESQLINHHQNKFFIGHDKLLESGAPKSVRDAFVEKSKKDFKKAYDEAYEIHKQTDKNLKNQFNNQSNIAKAGFSAAKVGSAIAGIGLLGSTIAGSKAVAAKRRTTAKSHAKAVSKRNEWQKQMKEAFKGTQYDTSKRTRNDNRKRRSSKA